MTYTVVLKIWVICLSLWLYNTLDYDKVTNTNADINFVIKFNMNGYNKWLSAYIFHEIILRLSSTIYIGIWLISRKLLDMHIGFNYLVIDDY